MEDNPITRPFRRSRASRLKAHLSQEVSESWADLVLLVCCFVTGLVDSAVFNVWSCFVGMQTGNSVYVGLGVSGQPASQPYRWAKSGTSILCYMAGSFVVSRVVRSLGPLKRSTVVGSFCFQAILIFISAALVEAGLVSGTTDIRHGKIDWIVLLPLGLLAFQAAAQTVMSRVLEFSEIPTVVLTSTYCDLMSDPALLTASLRDDSKRNRRILSVVLLILGAILGGYLTKGRAISHALWPAGVIKTLLAIVWFYWKAKGQIRLD